MINFFRKTRKKMADDNKPMKYMRYAIGEIALVVIGILIALSINNWNEERKDRKKGAVYAKKLIGDIVQDTLNLQDLITKADANYKSIQSYFEYFEAGNQSIQVFIDSSKGVEWSFFRYTPVNYTFEEMLSSGNLSLLTEKQRNLLMELSNRQKFLQIIIEKLISDIFVHIQEAEKYLDQDASESNFYEILFIKIDKNELSKGLLAKHNAYTSLIDLTKIMTSHGDQIKSISNKCAKSLESNLSL